MRALNLVLFTALLCVIPACLSKDESTTLYIEPTGEVELIVYRDNMRSTDDKASERKREHEEWIREARTQAVKDFEELRKAGATEIRHEVLRDRPPYAAVLTAKFPTLEAYARSIGLGSAEKEAKMTLAREGKGKGKTRLLIEVAAKTKEALEAKANAPKVPSAEPKSHPVYKIVPVGGKITGAKGFVVSSTKDSAMIDFAEIDTLEETGKAYELRLEWTN